MKTEKFRKLIDTTNPTNWIPYQNRWGHWVWRREDIYEDRGWPGKKPPNDKVIPKVLNGKWYWVECQKCKRK
jgi:hypothetical protein